MDLQIAKLRWQQQKAQAKNRLDRDGNLIQWKLSFDEWIKLWEESGHWDQRGVGSGKYCMSRKNDIGHYEVSNVEIKTQSENMKEGQLGIKRPQKGRTGLRGPHTEERKIAISVATKGRTPWNKGLKINKDKQIKDIIL